jgi:hypothetical protein
MADEAPKLKPATNEISRRLTMNKATRPPAEKQLEELERTGKLLEQPIGKPKFNIESAKTNLTKQQEK